jgi:hypothetical protein
MWGDTESITYLQNGRSVPILVLSRYLETAPGELTGGGHEPPFSTLPCHQAAGASPAETIAEILDSAGRERFLAKAAAFRDILTRVTPEQTLYRGIMGALGYARNKLPFEELADRVPLCTLETVAQQHLTEEQCLARQQALLLGTAGLLPSQRDIRCSALASKIWIEVLEKCWSKYSPGNRMTADSWNLVRVRPNNSPVRRIAGMSYLSLRYRKEGIFAGITELISEAKIDQAYSALVAGLTVMSSGYWETHYGFGCHSGNSIPMLIGNSRATSIVINIMLPFIHAWSQLKTKPELAAKALEIFNASLKPGTNTVERHMVQQLGRTCMPANSAQRQQGLIHIYKTLCTQGKCSVCPLGAAVKG